MVSHLAFYYGKRNMSRTPKANRKIMNPPHATCSPGCTSWFKQGSFCGELLRKADTYSSYMWRKLWKSHATCPTGNTSWFQTRKTAWNKDCKWYLDDFLGLLLIILFQITCFIITYKSINTKIVGKNWCKSIVYGQHSEVCQFKEIKLSHYFREFFSLEMNKIKKPTKHLRLSK